MRLKRRPKQWVNVYEIDGNLYRLNEKTYRSPRRAVREAEKIWTFLSDNGIKDFVPYIHTVKVDCKESK